MARHIKPLQVQINNGRDKAHSSENILQILITRNQTSDTYSDPLIFTHLDQDLNSETYFAKKNRSYVRKTSTKLRLYLDQSRK